MHPIAPFLGIATPAGINTAKNPSQVSVAPYAWWDAGSGVTISSGSNVSQWSDRVNSRVLTKPAGASVSPTRSTSDSAFGGAASISVASSDAYLESSQTSTDWAFLAGSSYSATVFAVFRSTVTSNTRTLWGTVDATPASPTMSGGYKVATNYNFVTTTYQAQVNYRGPAGPIGNGTCSGGTDGTTGSRFLVTKRSGQSASIESGTRNAGSGSVTMANVADPTPVFSLRLGTDGAASGLVLAHFAVWNASLPDADITALKSWAATYLT